MNTRELALDVLLEAEKNQSLSTNLVKDVLEKYDYEDPRDKAFFKRLTEGVMERQITLDYVLGCFSKTPVKKMKPLIRCLMRIGVYQILYMEGVPDSAACNEAVKLAKKRGFSTLSGFVNGVLRSVAKNRESIVWPDEIKEPAVFLSVRYSVPVWLVEKWIADYGYKRTLGMLEESVKVRPLTLHFKQSLGEQAVAEAVKAIADTKVRIMQHKVLPYAYVAEGADGVGSLPGYEEGLFWVQDVSSMLAVEAAGIRPGMKVLDICAAPGGKSMSAADKLNCYENAEETDKNRRPDSKLISCDVSEAKIYRIEENLQRTGFERTECRVQDAREFVPEMEGWADVVLADVPCSGLGVIGRKKEIRYRTTQEELEKLVQLQKEILDTAWRYVKPGGVLLYSTCTVNPDENEKMAAYIMERYPFEAESLDAYLPVCLHDEQTKKGFCQLFLGEYDTDGFFMARLRRKNGH